MNIPEEAVEAAVKAWDHHWGDRYGSEAMEEMGEEVRVALKAAAPFIAAYVLRDEMEYMDKANIAGEPELCIEGTWFSLSDWISGRAADIESRRD